MSWEDIKKEQLGDGPWLMEKALYTRDGYAAGFPNLPGGDLNTKVTYGGYNYRGYSQAYEKENILNSIRSLFIEIINPLTEWANKNFDGLTITSAYRSFKTNHFAAGSTNVSSQHTLGQAIDIRCKNGSCLSADIFNWIVDQGKQQKLVYDQMIWEFPENNSTSWVHVSHVNPASAQINYDEGMITMEDLAFNKGNRMLHTIATKAKNVHHLYQSEGNTIKLKKKFSGMYMDKRKSRGVSPEWVYPSVVDFFTSNQTKRWENNNYLNYDKNEWEADTYRYPRQPTLITLPLISIPSLTIDYEETGILQQGDYLSMIPYLNPPTLNDMVIRPNLFLSFAGEKNEDIKDDITKSLNLDNIIGELNFTVKEKTFLTPSRGTITATFSGFINGEIYTVKSEDQIITTEEDRKSLYEKFLLEVSFQLGSIKLDKNNYIFTVEDRTWPIQFGYYFLNNKI